VRTKPSEWSPETWRSVYNFPTEGEGNASRTNKFCHGKFTNFVHSKDGYVMSDCENLRWRRVLEFLVPIFSPDRPTRVMIILGNTLLGALTGVRKVN